MKMLNELTIVDMIENAHSDRPYCECGRDTAIIYRQGAVWLQCTVVDEPVANRVTRLWNVVTDPGHVNRMIVEVPRPQAQAA